MVWPSQVIALRTVVGVTVSASYPVAVTTARSPSEITTADGMKEHIMTSLTFGTLPSLKSCLWWAELDHGALLKIYWSLGPKQILSYLVHWNLTILNKGGPGTMKPRNKLRRKRMCFFKPRVALCKPSIEFSFLGPGAGGIRKGRPSPKLCLTSPASWEQSGQKSNTQSKQTLSS